MLAKLYQNNEEKETFLKKVEVEAKTKHKTLLNTCSNCLKEYMSKCIDAVIPESEIDLENLDYFIRKINGKDDVSLHDMVEVLCGTLSAKNVVYENERFSSGNRNIQLNIGKIYKTLSIEDSLLQFSSVFFRAKSYDKIYKECLHERYFSHIRDVIHYQYHVTFDLEKDAFVIYASSSHAQSIVAYVFDKIKPILDIGFKVEIV